MLTREKRTSASSGLLLGMPAGEGARRVRAQGPLQAQQRASEKGMVMQLAERPCCLWQACGKHSRGGLWSTFDESHTCMYAVQLSPT